MFPPQRILAAIDFSEPSRVAFDMAARLTAQCGSHLHVLFVEDRALCAAARINGVDLGKDARAELDSLIASSPIAATLAVHRHVVGGSAVEVICHLACREQADVVVVGTHGMSGAERLVFGSTAEGVLRQSPVPVLLVPHTWKAPSAANDLTGMGPVIVGVDFTAGSLEAVAAGYQLARSLHSSLELLHVVPALPVIPAWRQHADRAVAQRTDYARTELGRLARELGIDMSIETRIDTGTVPDRIARAARMVEGKHPILVLGRRLPNRRGDVPGGIAHRVASLAEMPTLMFMQHEPE